MITKILKFLIVGNILLLYYHAMAQNSFVRNLIEPGDTLSLGKYLSQIEKGSDGTLSLLYSQESLESVWLLNLAQDGSMEAANRISINSSAWKPYYYQRKDNFHLGNCRGSIMDQGALSLMVVNLEENYFWGKLLDNQSTRLAFSGFTQSGKIYTSFGLDSPDNAGSRIGVAFLKKEDGMQEWGYYYRRLNTPTPNELQYFYLKNMKNYPDNSLIAQLEINHFDYESGLTIESFGYGLLHIDEFGEIIKGIGIDNHQYYFYDIEVDADNNTYLTLKKEGDGNTFTERKPYGIIVKLDSDYHVLWSKKLMAEYFYCLDLEINLNQTGNIIFTYITYGDLPVITGEITPEGDLLWYRGYSFFAPFVSIGSDNAIFFTSMKTYQLDGTSNYEFLIAKTLPSGEITNCPQFDACIHLEEEDITFEEWEWSREDAPIIPDLPVSLLGFADFSSNPHCGTPAPPRADFILPDTICQYQCIQPDSVKNRLAHRVEWHITGDQIDTIITDDTFTWCFDQAGHYIVNQEVWLLGCSESYSQSLEVLSNDLQVSLGEDRTICAPKPYELNVTSVSPLSQIIWNNQSEENPLIIDSSGYYQVTASDGYCTAEAEVTLQFLEDIITEEPLVLPPDTLICNDFLPYVLRPQSPYSTTFYLNNSTDLSPQFPLDLPGVYRIGFFVDGCPIEQPFVLETAPCEVPVFIPNAFSPNDDGINDVITPLGVDFKGKDLTVFDRWGGILYTTTEFPFRWDGRSNGKKVQPGVYVLVFNYLNLRNNLKAIKVQEVSVLR